MTPTTKPPRTGNVRRGATPPSFEHGFQRADDRLPPPPPRRPTGLPLVLMLALGLLTAAGVVQVRTRARVLELGADIAELTAEHGRLLDEKRRLEAERAYLRHPDYIEDVAAGRMQMVPATPDRLQAIRLRDESKGTGPSKQGG
ncbi:Cell division protein FtsB [Nannocystis exedens]|uniref:Cell division protein FtsB n=1 Tax=Nannocystis exedens TaxID=54 RepID=A0A1I1VS20_9BACT|nr:cell division protein FtsL [Nannocystis exedens]PCC72799.1 Cell division protein FtsL [Nannocystis exedens]SFD85882.1 Cell division protein FtsB [Nannocystis exedens]